ncbi:MAG: response regulator [Sphingobacteriaceae bacterium]
MANINLTCIVDDDEIFVYAMKKLISLRNLCNEVMVFNLVEDAITYLKKHQSEPSLLPEIILLDINLPVMDGWDFLTEYKELNPLLVKKPAIYMLSSSSNPADQKRAEDTPYIKGYFVKPLSKEAFSTVFGAEINP